MSLGSFISTVTHETLSLPDVKRVTMIMPG